MKKIIRLTESDLVRLVKKVLKEQSTQEDYKEMADYLYSSMKGLSSADDAKNIKSVIYNRIENKNDWEGVKRAFGVRDGENLEQWLKGELRIDFNSLMNAINQNDAEFKKGDAMYNPGSKIRLITNRQFIQARAYQYANTMGKTVEMDLDINDSTVLRRDKDGIIVKASSVQYYDVSERERGGETPKMKFMYNVCIKIPFSDIIQWNGDSLQIRWFSDNVTSKIVPC